MELARWFFAEPETQTRIPVPDLCGRRARAIGIGLVTRSSGASLQNAVAMINMDMIGRLRDRKVYLSGVGTGTTFAKHRGRRPTRTRVRGGPFRKGGYGSSDHTSFHHPLGANPVLLLGLTATITSQRHWDKIDAPQTVKLLALIADIADRLSEDPARPQLVRVAPPKNGPAPIRTRAVRYRATALTSAVFRISPRSQTAFASPTYGQDPRRRRRALRLATFSEFDGKPIQNLYDFTYALRASKPGQEVLVK